MNYKEKYELTLEKARGVYNSAKSDKENGVSDKITEYTIKLMETIFPELKEPEDEKIREQVVYAIKQLHVCECTKNKLLAWLENQGKKESQGKSAIEAWKEMRLEVYAQASGNRHEPNYSDDSTKMFSLNDIDEIFEKITEIQSEHTDPCHTCDHQVLSCNDFPCEKKQSKQKSNTNSLTNNVWSEKDEKTLDDACIMLDWYKGNNWWKAQYIINWLKSLKNRVQPQPKQEWSKEDEDYYDAIIAKLEVTQDDATLTDNQMEFLKSLKDRIGG